MQAYYLREVYPRLSLPLADKYPLTSLRAGAGQRPLGERPLLMLVALTGTGKSTTLDLLRQRIGAGGLDIIPSRREVADWIAIPLAQSLAGEPLAPVSDRVQRFAYTQQFAQRVPGGMAAAFSWLYFAESHQGLVLSEGIRGPQELRFALGRFPRWQIVELTLHPLTRLRRFSQRDDAFDQAPSRADLSFLPRAMRAEARALLAAGEISPQALAIIGAEAANYGLAPFAAGAAYANYHRLAVDGASPAQVAEAVLAILQAG